MPELSPNGVIPSSTPQSLLAAHLPDLPPHPRDPECYCRDCYRPPCPYRKASYTSLDRNFPSGKFLSVKGSLPSFLSGHPPEWRREFRNRWLKLRQYLIGLFPKIQEFGVAIANWGRIDMVMRGMAIQAGQGACFASASYLASKAAIPRNEKTWDRTVKYLKGLGLIETIRLHWAKGNHVHKLATNAIDFSALWNAFLLWLRPQYGRAGMAGTLTKYGYHKCDAQPGGAEFCMYHPNGEGTGGLPPEQEEKLFKLFAQGRQWVASWEL